ncbi:hypothetical protein MMC30_006442 [Trapelia coarctata]|nr:hypothetical protein [Trapelia coarctata]
MFDISIGYCNFPDQDDSQLDVCFELDRLEGNDPDIAVFAEKQAKTTHKEVSMRELRQHLLVVRPMNYWPRPPQVVQARRHANDTELPGFQVDWDKQEARFDWRSMFTTLHSKQKLNNVLTERMVSLFQYSPQKLTGKVTDIQVLPWAKKLPEQGGDIGADIMREMETLLDKWADMRFDHRKIARRKRIERQFKCDCGDEYVPYFGDEEKDSDDVMGSEEALALAELREINSGLSWRVFSDDEEDDKPSRNEDETESEGEPSNGADSETEDDSSNEDDSQTEDDSSNEDDSETEDDSSNENDSGSEDEWESTDE